MISTHHSPPRHSRPQLFRMTTTTTTPTSRSPTGNTPVIDAMNLSDEERSSSEEDDARRSSSHKTSRSIRRELQSIRGDLFDIADAESTVGLVLEKVQQLTEFENRVVEEQWKEIETLRGELERMRQKESEAARRLHNTSLGDGSIPSFDSITMDGSSVGASIGASLGVSVGGFTNLTTNDASMGGFTNESEKETSYSLLTNQQLAQNLSQNIAAATELKELESSKLEMQDELEELMASKERIREEVEELERMETSKFEMEEGIAAVTQELEELTASKEMIQREMEELKGMESSKFEMEEGIAAVTQELEELTASKERIQREMEELKGMESSKFEMEEGIAAVTQELKDLESSKERIQQEIEHLKQQVQALLQERTKLIQEVEVYTHQCELAQELEAAQEANGKLQDEMESLRETAARCEERISQAVKERESAERFRDEALSKIESLRERAAQSERAADQVKKQAVQQWEGAAAEKEAAEERLHSMVRERKRAQERATTEALVREEMQKEMRKLYEEKIACEAELDDLRRSGAAAASDRPPGSNAAVAADIARLKGEIEALRGENASLRSATRRDSEVIERLNDDIRSLVSARGTADPDPETPPERSPDPADADAMAATPVTSNASAARSTTASRKRALAWSQGSAGEDERGRESKRSVRHERQKRHDRFNSAGSVSLELISGQRRERLGSSESNGGEGGRSGEGSGGGSDAEGRPPRDRSHTCGSDTYEDTVSALNEEHNSVSLLFGQGEPSVVVEGPRHGDKYLVAGEDAASPKSDHDGIRAHAEKLLYWANRASERSSKKGGNGDASVASGRSERHRGATSPRQPDRYRPAASPPGERPRHQGGAPRHRQQQRRGSASKYASPIPKTIGLPPRSQSRVRRSSGARRLPPRCPPASTSSVSDGNSTTAGGRSDKENTGSVFNVALSRGGAGEVPGAFPTFSLPPSSLGDGLGEGGGGGGHGGVGGRRGKKNVSVSEVDNTIIHNLDYTDDDPVVCCECTVSPFSGNDPQSEFYLPKLGLACNCGKGGGAILRDRTSFSRNPTALAGILRPWQCDFLSATLNVTTADGLLRAHKADANDVARRMKRWRVENGMAPARSKECYVALKIWSRTCKVVLRSIREQRERAARRKGKDGGGGGGGGEGGNGGEAGGGGGESPVIERPHFLDITFADTHTIASISTLGQFSSVGGDGRPFEMMEI